MNKQEHVNKLIEQALESVNNAERATPKPFLLTRINARMSKATESTWEKAGRFVGRPVVAFTGLCFVLLLNAVVIISNKSTTAVIAGEQVAQNNADEFSYTIATIYDTDNTQP